MIEKITRRFLFLGLALFALPVVFFSPASAVVVPTQFNLTITPSGNGLFNLSWDAMTDPNNPASAPLYIVYSTFGASGGGDPIAPPYGTGAGNFVVSVPTATTRTGVSLGNGSFCLVVLASSSVNGSPAFSRSFTKCHSYIHQPGLTNEAGVLRADAAGGQNGVGQQWNFTYYLDDDSLVTMRVYPQGTTFTTDPYTGFKTPTAVQTATKTIVDSTPRSGELAGGTISNVEFWDLRNSSGQVVPNGIYTLWASISSPVNNASNPIRFQGILATIPVDVLRLLSFNSVGITPAVTTAKINYQITGDASVRIVISTPGSVFYLDANGDIQPLKAVGGVPLNPAQTDQGAIVQVLTFNRNGSGSAYSETWDGKDLTGVAVSSGVYSVGISARDAFGNQAVNSSGDEAPVATTLPVDRGAGSSGSSGSSGPTVSAATINGTALTLNGTVALPEGGSFNDIVFTLSGPADYATAVTLKVPQPLPANGIPLAPVTLAPAGTVTPSLVSPTKVTYSTNVVQSATGTYVVSVTPVSGGVSGSVHTYNFTLPSSSGNGTASAADRFKNSVVAYPNPVRSAPARIDFILLSPSTVDIDIYTLLGERLFHQTSSYAAGTQTFNWNLVNDAAGGIGSGIYLVRITARDGANVFSSTRKLMVIR